MSDPSFARRERPHMRAARLILSMELFEEMLDLPPDVRFADVRMDWNADTASFLVVSPGLPEVESGQAAPTITPIYYRPYVGGARLKELPTYQREIEGRRRTSDRPRDGWQPERLTIADVDMIQQCIEESFELPRDPGCVELISRFRGALREYNVQVTGQPEESPIIEPFQHSCGAMVQRDPPRDPTGALLNCTNGSAHYCRLDDR